MVEVVVEEGPVRELAKGFPAERGCDEGLFEAWESPNGLAPPLLPLFLFWVLLVVVEEENGFPAVFLFGPSRKVFPVVVDC